MMIVYFRYIIINWFHAIFTEWQLHVGKIDIAIVYSKWDQPCAVTSFRPKAIRLPHLVVVRLHLYQRKPRSCTQLDRRRLILFGMDYRWLLYYILYFSPTQYLYYGIWCIYTHTTYVPMTKFAITLIHAHTCTHDVRSLISVGVKNFICDFYNFLMVIWILSMILEVKWRTEN